MHVPIFVLQPLDELSGAADQLRSSGGFSYILLCYSVNDHERNYQLQCIARLIVGSVSNREIVIISA